MECECAESVTVGHSPKKEGENKHTSVSVKNTSMKPRSVRFLMKENWSPTGEGRRGGQGEKLDFSEHALTLEPCKQL